MNAFLGRAIAFFFLLLGAAVVLLPFVWMLLLSVKPADEIFSAEVDLLPSRIAWENYAAAFREVPLARYLLNGMIVCAGILSFQLLFAIPCAFALARRTFFGRKLVFGLVLAGLLVPYHVTAIPLFLGLAELKLLNTYAALIIPFIASVFGLFLFRQAFATLPQEVLDAARVDGLSEGAIVWRIAFPLIYPAATAFAVFSVVAHWNDLFWPLIAVTDPDLATPPRGILYFRDEEAGSDFGPLMAAATIITAPLIIGFLLAQRAFTQGFATAGRKG